MKKLIILIVLIFISIQVEAKTWYIIDSENRIVAKQNGPVKQEELDRRGWIQVEEEEDISFEEAEYRGNKVVKHVKTGQEIAEEAQEKSRKDKKVVDKGTAKAKLITLGMTSAEAELLLE